MRSIESDVVVGRLPALACLRAGRREVYRALVYENAEGIEEIIAALPAERIVRTDRASLDRLANGTRHQGVVLEVSPLPLLSLGAWLDKGVPEQCVVLILDSITDPMNFGAVIRSAAAFGAAGVLFQKDRAAPITPAVVKASAGGVEYMDLIQATNLVRDIQRLKKEGFWVNALDAGGDRLLWQADLRGRVALVIGSEGMGIRRLVKEHSDFIVSIPVRKELDSLNASVSAGIALGEWVRQNQSGFSDVEKAPRT
jgi:23S rRNA (guanosine2251-2'-O)-methyltransferase